MSEVITDTYEFTVEIIQHGDLVISNVVAPNQVDPGADFTVEYDVTNNGTNDTCFGYIKDIDSDNEIAGTRWQQGLQSGQTQHFYATITGRATALNAQIVVGYYTE